ncbi:MAG: PD-(D/E)XK nuclease family protein [Opitutales bacterium]|jgi:hypothetical protein
MPLRCLRVADHPAAVWAETAEPWLRARGAQWRERRAVLVPNAAWAAALKAQAVEHGLPVIGVNWFTPGKFRAQALRLLPGPSTRIALREDLHLLIELAAAGLPENPLARAYGTDAAPFQELLDALEGAGWNAEVLPDVAARELAEAAAQLRRRAGWLTAAEADRALQTAVAKDPKLQLGEHLLVAGFGPSDWALRPLLEAAADLYAEAELVLEVVDYALPAAAAWVGTWEERAGSADWLEAPAEKRGRFMELAASLASKPAAGVASGPLPRLHLADDLQAEANLVVAQALAFLGEAGGGPARVGIVVGSVNSPLAREVAARFVALELPHHDALGHQPGRTTAQALFEAWLDWQENGRLAGLVGWLRAAQRLGRMPERDAAAVEEELKSAAEATLADDPAVLSAWLQAAKGERAAAFLAEWPRLPESATWEVLMAGINAVAEKLEWPDPPGALAERAGSCAGAVTGPVPRAAVLRWVRAVTRVPGRTRDGREPFAPLQIVEAASAAAQPWTHLVLGGLQHGEWPADEDDSPLLEEARVKMLNRQVLRQGSQGEGHSTLAPGHGWLLTSGERHQLARAAFARLAGLPTTGLALTARRTDPADGRAARLSEYFWTTAAQVLGRLPEDRDWDDLLERSRAWKESARKIWAGAAQPDAPDVAAPARAYAARRNLAAPFDEFSFCLKKTPAETLRLSCKAWEEAVARPGATWFKQLLRVEARWEPATEDGTRRVIGTWAHAWVRPGPGAERGDAAPASQPLPERSLWEKLVVDRAEGWREKAAAAFAAAGRPVPEAWLDAWASAGRAAHGWIEALAELDGWPEGLAEIHLPPGLKGVLPLVDATLPLAGRLDLVLLARAGVFAPGGLTDTAAWLVDFKSGSDEPLRPTRLAKGEGVQLALYALALRALGAGAVQLTLLAREGAAEAQLTGVDLEDPKLEGLWRLLSAMAGGRWGEFHDLADEHDRPGDYPLATLPPAGEILRRKWELTHQDFV